ncbi:MAG: hypothetical protein RL026_803 [Pseudomonadota bacterium]|jgi:cell wall-associated NlpC family hydrolase
MNPRPAPRPSLLALCIACVLALPARAQQEPVSLAQMLLDVARGQLGQPYRRAGSSPSGFDCSGLTRFVHAAVGIELPRTAQQQRQGSLPLARGELQPGDLVFFTTGRHLVVNHVGIYLGEGNFIHAPRVGQPVRLAHLDEPYFERRFAGGGRYWDISGRAPTP